MIGRCLCIALAFSVPLLIAVLLTCRRMNNQSSSMDSQLGESELGPADHDDRHQGVGTEDRQDALAAMPADSFR